LIKIGNKQPDCSLAQKIMMKKSGHKDVFPQNRHSLVICVSLINHTLSPVLALQKQATRPDVFES